jgi:plastocyanin
MRTTAVRYAGLLIALSGAVECAAGTLEISVVDEQGKPLEHVAVYAMPQASGDRPARNAAAASEGQTPTATMDQMRHQFVPHLLVVQAGTEVTFPNSDDVSHHVYSFSPTKTFELPLYKGDLHPPVMFEQPGIVVVGCNIHDGMLGYIRVVDTPYFAVTNEQGVALIDGIPSGDYSVAAWTPRVRPADSPAPLPVAVAGGALTAEIRITGRLAPPHAQGASSLTWDRY